MSTGNTDSAQNVDSATNSLRLFGAKLEQNELWERDSKKKYIMTAS